MKTEHNAWRRQDVLLPLASLVTVDPAEANALLTQWGHLMGPLKRGNTSGLHAHLLIAHDQPVAVAVTASLIRERVGGGLGHMDRSNCIELARLCAAEPWACRVMLRLWRELVFPGLGVRYAISYQDADVHTGNTYRFDGWRRLAYSHSGVDRRTGRKGRKKWIWVWERGGKMIDGGLREEGKS